MKNGTSIDRRNILSTGLGIMTPKPTPRAIIPTTVDQTGAKEGWFGSWEWKGHVTGGRQSERRDYIFWWDESWEYREWKEVPRKKGGRNGDGQTPGFCSWWVVSKISMAAGSSASESVLLGIDEGVEKKRARLAESQKQQLGPAAVQLPNLVGGWQMRLLTWPCSHLIS